MLPEVCKKKVIEIHQALHSGGQLPVINSGWTHGKVMDFRGDVKCVVYRRGSEIVKILTQNINKQDDPVRKWWQAAAKEGKKVSQVQYCLKNAEGTRPQYNFGAGVVVDNEYTDYTRK